MLDRQYLDLDSKRLEYHLLPGLDRHKPTLVLLHEGLGCVDLWKDFPAALASATGCAVLAYSRIGYGRSSPVALPRPRDYLSVEGPEELKQVLDRLTSGSVILVGHSDGGSIAMAYGARRDPRVRGIVSLAGHVSVEAVCLVGIRRAVEAFRRSDLRDRLAEYHGDNLDGALRGWSETWLRDDFRDWNLFAELPAIEVPLLALQGREDEYATAEQLAIIAKEASNATTVLLEHCRHFPQNQAREETLRLIQALLRRLAVD